MSNNIRPVKTRIATRDFDLAGLDSGRTLRHWLALRHLWLGGREFAGGAGCGTPVSIWLAHRGGRLATRLRTWPARVAAGLAGIAGDQRGRGQTTAP